MLNNTSNQYLTEPDGGATTTVNRPSGSLLSYIYPSQQYWVYNDFSIEYEVSQNVTGDCLFGFYNDSSNPTITTAFRGTNIYFLQSIIGTYTKPVGDTYRLKIERVGFVVKFYVNDVEVASGTQTQANYISIKVPFFTMRPNVYIVDTTITLKY
jgi:hypothetical protein